MARKTSTSKPTPKQADTVKPKKEPKEILPPKPKIVQWVPEKEDLIAAYDGRMFYLKFENVVKSENDKVAVYDNFFIRKSSYEKQLDVIVRYINFFIKFYDPDNEMIANYLAIKFALDRDNMFDENTSDQLISLIYELFFTDTIIEKINRLVEDNYLDDIESTDDSKKYAKKEKKHLESLEFTNQHIKILLRISFGMKCIAPIMLHYVYKYNIKLDRDSDLIFNFYRRLFDIFTDPGVSMYNKLFTYVKAKVLESKSHNSSIFDQRDILGVDEYTVISQFLRKVLISENIVKYKFNEHWDPKAKKYKENIVGLTEKVELN